MDHCTSHSAGPDPVEWSVTSGADATLLHDLRTALARPGCSICRLVDRSVRRHVFSIYYDLVMESEVRNALRQSRGLCHDHTWLAVEMEQQRQGDGGGMALILEDVLSTIQADIDRTCDDSGADGWGARLMRAISPRNTAASIKTALRPRRTCSACVAGSETSDLFARLLARYVDRRDVATALEASFGLCLGHWGQAIEVALTAENRTALHGRQRAKTHALFQELHAAARRSEANTTDDTWIRAAELLVGRRHHPDMGDDDVVEEWRRAWSEEIARYKRYRGVLWHRETGEESSAVIMDDQQLRYLTAPLIDVARRHILPDERVLTAIYVDHGTRNHPRYVFGFAREMEVHTPRRAFVLTPQRVLILDDPTDRATSTADREYLTASCPLERIIALEMRSHLLDCAVTLVMATPRAPERVTVEYNGVIESAFLAAVACLRALMEGHPLPPYTRADMTYGRERRSSLALWHQVLAGLSMKQEHAVDRYLVAGEQVQEWLAVPLIDRSRWWQRLGLSAHEVSPGVLVRTDRQLLLVKETMRIVRGEATYGSDTWLMPQCHLRAAQIVPGERERELQVCLQHAGVSELVRLPLPAELEERALALALGRLHDEDRD